MIIFLALILIFLVILIGGERGAMSIMTLAGNIVILFFSIILMSAGFPVLLLILVAGAGICYNSLFYQNGNNPKTRAAFLATMNIIKMISKKNCYIGQNKPAYIVIHETDNWSKGADAKAHATAMKNGNLAGTVHYYVDSKSVYQTLDHSDGAWAVGDGKGKYGITNRNSINIEICVNPETDYYKAVDKAEQLAAQLLKQYGWEQIA